MYDERILLIKNGWCPFVVLRNDANDCLQFFAESMQEIAENRKCIDQ